jgi:hypothetical protein
VRYGFPGIEVLFNRGIVAAQWVSRRLGVTGHDLQNATLERIIEAPGDRFREYLSGQLGARLFSLLESAASGRRHLYAALYELDDPQLMAALTRLGRHAHVVLANGSVKKKGQDQNAEARGTHPEIDEAGSGRNGCLRAQSGSAARATRQTCCSRTSRPAPCHGRAQRLRHGSLLLPNESPATGRGRRLASPHAGPGPPDHRRLHPAPDPRSRLTSAHHPDQSFVCDPSSGRVTYPAGRTRRGRSFRLIEVCCSRGEGSRTRSLTCSCGLCRSSG